MQSFDIRWFTPTTEVKLCGHASLAAAGVLLRAKLNRNNEIEFRSKSGPLIIYQDPDHENQVAMKFPTNPPQSIELSAEVQEIIKHVC